MLGQSLSAKRFSLHSLPKCSWELASKAKTWAKGLEVSAARGKRLKLSSLRVSSRSGDAAEKDPPSGPAPKWLGALNSNTHRAPADSVLVLRSMAGNCMHCELLANAPDKHLLNK